MLGRSRLRSLDLSASVSNRGRGTRKEARSDGGDGGMRKEKGMRTEKKEEDKTSKN